MKGVAGLCCYRDHASTPELEPGAAFWLKGKVVVVQLLVQNCLGCGGGEVSMPTDPRPLVAAPVQAGPAGKGAAVSGAPGPPGAFRPSTLADLQFAVCPRVPLPGMDRRGPVEGLCQTGSWERASQTASVPAGASPSPQAAGV